MGSFGSHLHLEGVGGCGRVRPWGMWNMKNSFHSAGVGRGPGKEKDKQKRAARGSGARRELCVQSRGGEGGRWWQPAEWACIKEGRWDIMRAGEGESSDRREGWGL